MCVVTVVEGDHCLSEDGYQARPMFVLLSARVVWRCVGAKAHLEPEPLSRRQLCEEPAAYL